MSSTSIIEKIFISYYYRYRRILNTNLSYSNTKVAYLAIIRYILLGSTNIEDIYI